MFAVIVAVLASTAVSFAQDAELNTLTDLVKSLKAGGEKAYKAAVAALAADKYWTPMDELGIVREAECKASERTPGFRLNSALTNAENKERYQTTTANHLNGADSRYAYSLFEKTLKAGASASYELPGRWGQQTFILIPYSGGISADVSSDGVRFSSSPMGDGALRFSGNAVKDKPVKVEVRNSSSSNVSYVLINYNSRK